MPPSKASRLGRLAHQCGNGSLSVLIDHQAQLDAVATITEIAGFKIGIFVKVDTGYHRAGLNTTSAQFKALVAHVLSSIEPAGNGYLQGFYSHAGHSYSGDSKEHAMSLLLEELSCLEKAAQTCDDLCSRSEDSRLRPLTLSVGATPTATSIQNINDESTQSTSLHRKTSELKSCIERINKKYEIEIHAGVYPILDLQQLATRASPPASVESTPTADASPSGSSQSLSTADLGLTILAEVVSLYSRHESSEALVAAGSLALGREPCKSYSGWGVVSPWSWSSGIGESPLGWIVGRISQEHGVLTKEPGCKAQADLQVGQRVRIWPNHAW